MMDKELLQKTREKAEHCRLLFTRMVLKYIESRNALSPAASEKAVLILLFLIQSEQSYVLRRFNLEKEQHES